MAKKQIWTPPAGDLPVEEAASAVPASVAKWAPPAGDVAEASTPAQAPAVETPAQRFSKMSTGQKIADVAGGAIETPASLVNNALAGVAGLGVGGVANYLVNPALKAMGREPTNAADVQRKVTGALSYTPSTASGQRSAGAITETLGAVVNPVADAVKQTLTRMGLNEYEAGLGADAVITGLTAGAGKLGKVVAEKAPSAVSGGLAGTMAAEALVPGSGVAGALIGGAITKGGKAVYDTIANKRSAPTAPTARDIAREAQIAKMEAKGLYYTPPRGTALNFETPGTIATEVPLGEGWAKQPAPLPSRIMAKEDAAMIGDVVRERRANRASELAAEGRQVGSTMNATQPSVAELVTGKSPTTPTPTDIKGMATRATEALDAKKARAVELGFEPKFVEMALSPTMRFRDYQAAGGTAFDNPQTFRAAQNKVLGFKEVTPENAPALTSEVKSTFKTDYNNLSGKLLDLEVAKDVKRLGELEAEMAKRGSKSAQFKQEYNYLTDKLNTLERNKQVKLIAEMEAELAKRKK